MRRVALALAVAVAAGAVSGTAQSVADARTDFYAGDYDEALSTLRTAVRRYGTDVEARRLLVDVLIRVGDYTEAATLARDRRAGRASRPPRARSR